MRRRRWQDECEGVCINDGDIDLPCVNDIDPRKLNLERETTQEEKDRIAEQLRSASTDKRKK